MERLTRFEQEALSSWRTEMAVVHPERVDGWSAGAPAGEAAHHQRHRSAASGR